MSSASLSRPDRPQSLRICLLGEGWPPDSPGGLNRYVEVLFTSLTDARARVRGVVVGPVAAPPAGLVVAGNAASRLRQRLREFADVVVPLADDSDVIDVHFALYGVLPLLRGAARRKGLVAHFHGPWADESAAAGEDRPLVVAAKRRVERLVYRRAAVVVTLSSAFRQVVVERYAVSPWRVQVVPPAVDLDRFQPGEPAPARASLDLPDGVQVVACVRRLVPRMGVDDLIEAWATMPGELDDRVLVIAGDGPSAPALSQAAQDRGVADSVRFLGSISEAELVACYQAADLCVVPSRGLEGFGLVVLESLACGTPVITTDAGGLPEALGAFGTDAVVPAGRPDRLAARIDGALSGREPLPSPVACRNHASKFSTSALADAHLGLYDRAVSTPPDERLRVVFLDHCAKLSGAEIALLRLLEGLPNVVPHVILGEDGPLVGRLNRAGVSVEVMPLDSAARDLGRDQVQPSTLPIGSVAHTAWYVARLARRLRALRPDLVHTNSLKASMYGSLAARSVGVPMVWHARDRMAVDYLPDTAARLVRAASRTLSGAVIANSAATMATLGPPRRGHPSVVIADPFARRRPATAPPIGPLRIGIVGRLAPWKGQDVLLEAFAKAFPDGPERLVVIGSPLFGEDDFEAALKAQAERIGTAGRVVFRGFRDDVEAEVDALHVVVHASVVPEPFGQVVVEAMAAGRAVVASDQGGPAEIITHGVDGLLCPPSDPDELAALLVRLAADGALRERLGAAAAETATRYRPDVIGPAVEGVFRQVARRG